MSKEANNRVIAAIDTSAAFMADYWQKCQDQRDPRSPHAAGSTIRLARSYADPLENLLKIADWEPYHHPDVLPQCSAFRTNQIHGRVGIVELARLDFDRVLEVADPKGTGYADVIMPLTRDEAEEICPLADFTVIILGPSGNGELVWTFHPGAPIAPSTFPTPATRTITVRDALAAGLTHAKIRVV